MPLHRVPFLLTILLASISARCSPDALAKKTWHEKFGWTAEKYFPDPKVISLCEAIESEDLAEIDRLVAAGADVNAKGMGNMTPLLWAFPDDRPERFKKLLELGANPNVIVESDFNTKMSAIIPGDSVTHLSCKTKFPKYFDLVFQHGGDPNLWHRKKHETPLLVVIRGPATDKKGKVARLVELGADLNANKNYAPTGGATPVMVAVSSGGQYAVALQLLKAGADYKVQRTIKNMTLVDILRGEKRRLLNLSPEAKADYRKLVDWLEQRGESVEDVRGVTK